MRAKMKNRFVKIAKALTAGLVLAAGLLGCSLDASDSSSGEKKAYLSVSNNSISRLIKPNSDITEYNIVKAELKYVKTGSGDAEQVAKTWETDFFGTDTALSLMLSDSNLYVQPGTYDFTLNLYTASLNFTSHPPILCQSGTIKAKKVGEGVNKLEFSTTYAEDGSGDLSVSLYWNSDSGIEYVKARLFEMEDDLSLDKGTSIKYEKIYDEEEEPFPPNQATYEVVDLKQGYYGLFVELYDKDDFLLNSLPYTVRIISGCISSANYTLDGINKRYALTFVNNKYAKWTGANPNRKYNENTIITLPTEDDISLEGYYFLGWNTEPNGSGKSYTPGSEIQLTDDLTLYSVWTDQVCTITFLDGTNLFTKKVPKFVPFSVPEDELSKPLSAYDCWLLGTEEYDFTKPVTSDLTLVAVYNFEEQEGSEENPYLIESLSDYYTFVRTVNSGLNYYEGKYLKFTNDIGSDQMPVEFAVGTRDENECFKGTLDGNGKKLTVKLSSDESYFATFRAANNATIKNLTLAGSITSSESYSAGLVSFVYGTVNIQNCIIEAAVSNTHIAPASSSTPNLYMGGFVSEVSGNVNIENSAFTGQFRAPGSVHQTIALFVSGYSYNIKIKNCLAAPSYVYVNSNGSYIQTFSYRGSRINCYYVIKVGSVDGVQAYETADDNLYKKVTLCDGKVYYLKTTYSGNNSADYTGNAVASNFIVKLNHPKAEDTGTEYYTLQEGTDYVIRYNKESGAPVPEMVDSGMYTLTFTGKGEFTGSFKAAFYVKKPLEGSGTEDEPYLINDAADWKTFGDNVADGTELYSGKYVKLMADIGTAECPVTTMVGGNSEAKSFQGTFDGNGKTITIGYNSTDYYSNPFRYIKNATIKNLIVKGTNISSKSYVSGLVGRSYGTSVIDNCLVDVDVSTSYSSSSYIYMAGFVSDAEAEVDGNLTVSNSAFTGKLGYKGTSTVQFRYCGGFIGCNNAASITLSNLIFAPSEIVGKYYSSMSGTLYYNYNSSASVTTENCYYTVSLGAPQETQVVASPVENSLVKKLTVPYVETVYFAPTVEVTGIDDSYSYTGSALSISDPVVTFDGAALTADTDYTLTVKTSSGQVVALDSVTDSDEYTIVIEGKGDYASSIKKTFSVFKSLSGSGTEEDPFLINNVTDWKFFADSIEASSGSNETYEGKFVKLTADLGTAENPLTRWMSGTDVSKLFKGTFDGNGKTITVNFNTDKVCTSLFGYLRNAAVKNLSIAGKITTTKWYVGSIAGITYGNITVENCKSSVEISSNYSGSNHYTGGFIGAAASNANSGNVIFEKCAFTGKINSTKKSINLVSGFVGDGFSNGTFTCNNCLFAPEEIDLTYAEANRQRTFFTNGISNNINITNSYYTTRLAPEGVEEQGKLTSKNLEDLSSCGIVSLTKKTLADGNDYYVCQDVTLENFDEVHALSGFALNIAPDVKFSGITVTSGTDYTITILDSKGNEVTSVSKPGDYTLKLTGIGSYAGSQSFSFKIIGALDGVGTEENPYLIGDVVDWNNFAALVTGGTTFEGEFIKLKADIGSKENPVTKMAGTIDNAFKGIFDGNGKTLTVNYDSAEEYTAPFRAIIGATIKNLTVDGEITSSNKYVAGIAAYVSSNVTISDCVVKASVQSTLSDSDSTQKYLGGFIAKLNGGTSYTANIKNSIFCGKIKATGDNVNYCASFVAYQGTQLKFDNCLDAPVEVAGSYNADSSHNYVGDKSNISGITATYINCNYIVSDAGVFGNNDSSIIQAYNEIPENTNALYQRKDFTGYGTVYAAETSKLNNVSTIYDWTRSEISIDEQVAFGSTTLTRGTDYTVEILDRDGNDVTSITNSGEYIFKVTGIGDYANSMEKKFAVFRVLSCSAADEPAGTEANPYLITCVPDWNLFADRVIWGDTYQGKHVQLDSDVGTTYAPVTRMVGEANETNCFMGTFNGNGKALTVKYEATEMNTAPFRYARKVTIKNLKIKGTIETSFNYTAGLIADLAGNSTIDNCTSSVEIKVTKNESGARPVCISGFVASAMSKSEKLTFQDCLFDGKLLNSPDSLEPSQISGFVGYVDYDYAYFYDCLFNPAEVGTYKDGYAGPFYGYSGGKSLERHCKGSVWVTAYGGTKQGKEGSQCTQGFISLDDLPEGESADNYEQVTKCGTDLYVKK